MQGLTQWFCSGRDKNGYYHELFLRGKRFLAHRIPRSKLKGQGARKPTSPETEPNFYLFTYLPTGGSSKAKQLVGPSISGNEHLPSSLLQGNLPLEQMLRGVGLRPPMLALPRLPPLPPAANGLQSSSKSLYESILGNHLNPTNTSPFFLPPSGQEWSGLMPGSSSSLPPTLGGTTTSHSNQGLLAAAGLLGPPPSDLSSVISPDLALRIALSQASMRGRRSEAALDPRQSSSISDPHFWPSK